MYITDLETPALVADKNKMQKNLDTMMGLLEGAKPKLRPHYKTNKTPQIALWQLKNGAIGITCSKLSEAEDLAAAGVDDILIANPVIGNLNALYRGQPVHDHFLHSLLHLRVTVKSKFHSKPNHR